MRVLLLGGTGNLGSRLIPALLAHNQVVITHVRSITKLQSLISPSLFSQIIVVQGDATDAASVKRALVELNCDAVIDVAGTQVRPWQEYLLPKIVKAVAEAAIEVGQERGKPLRSWFCAGMGLLPYGDTKWLIQDCMPPTTYEQHQASWAVLSAIPTSELQWSLLCPAFMIPVSPTIESLSEPWGHSLLIAGDKLPEWRDSWVKSIPIIGNFLNVVADIRGRTTQLEDVADMIAEDVESKSLELVGKRVGMKQKEKSI